MNTGISYWNIWIINRTKMRFLPLFHFDTRLLNSKHPKLFVLSSFQFSTPLNSQNPHDNEIQKNSLILILIGIPAFPFCICEVSNPWNGVFCLFYCFSAPQNAKNYHQLKYKNQIRNWRFLNVRSSSIKDYTCH
jgi:hypothetical protein